MRRLSASKLCCSPARLHVNSARGLQRAVSGALRAEKRCCTSWQGRRSSACRCTMPAWPPCDGCDLPAVYDVVTATQNAEMTWPRKPTEERPNWHLEQVGGLCVELVRLYRLEHHAHVHQMLLATLGDGTTSGIEPGPPALRDDVLTLNQFTISVLRLIPVARAI